LKPSKHPLAAIRWHGRLEPEATTLTLAESAYALAALTPLGEGDKGAVEVLKATAKVPPTLLLRM
jgi:hypothetical protein